MNMRFANEFGFCELNSFPGSPQIVVSNAAYIYPKFRGKGAGRLNHELRVARAKFLGYDYLMCTVCANNTPELAIMKEHSFKELDEFVSTTTGHVIKIFGKIIRKE